MWKLLHHINPYSVSLVLLFLFAGCFAVFPTQRRGRDTSGGSRIAFSALLILTLAATLTPQQPIGSSDYKVWLMPGQGLLFDYSAMGWLERSMYVRQQIANLLMFVPLAMTFRFAWPRFGTWGPVIMGLLLSLSIEVVQWGMAAGRVVDIDDVIVNTVGACLGALLCLAGERLAQARKAQRPVGTASHRRR
ncbi:hypothetical protein vnz_33880 [Streptomyces venezuelae]|nr:hypothetical protein vnz_33880 [Streptomyces venezuelae]